jgi:uncharacterized protein (TIGR01777 family)
MLGSALGTALEQQGATLLRLVRRQPGSSDEIRWDPAGQGVTDPEKLEGLTAAIHLSGANVSSRRWTPAYKQEMAESRVTTTRVLSETLARLGNPPSVLIAASAVGFYGNRGNEILEEDSLAGRGYFPTLCQEWEAATRPAEEAGIRVVHLRFGVVIGPDGGVLAKMLPLFRLGMGGRLGDGHQWMSWISEFDAVSAALFVLNNTTMSGPFNTVAPNPVTNTAFTEELAKAVHRAALIPAPAFALRLAFGEMADEALLASTRAIPRRLQDAGFEFAYPKINEALAAALPA